MTSARISKVWRTTLLTITIFSLSLPAYAKYGRGTGEPNDAYQIATAEDLILLGDSPEDYGKHFILIADIELYLNLNGCIVFNKTVIESQTCFVQGCKYYCMSLIIVDKPFVRLMLGFIRNTHFVSK